MTAAAENSGHALKHNFSEDVDAIASVAAVPTILDVVCRTTGMGFAAVARVTEDRWVACSVLDNIHFGLKPGGELEVATTICHEIRQSGEAVVIDHVAEDGAFCGHPTPAQYGFQSYISMPIVRKDGSFFGTLCAIDPSPARLKNPETIGMFKLFAELIAAQLDANDQLTGAYADLKSEREHSELREQFIAVLGHDLRNPVAAIDAGTKLLQRKPLDEASKEVVSHMQRSVIRMRGLIDNVLDLTHARLGGGLPLEIDTENTLGPVIEHVVGELRAIHPAADIEVNIALDQPIALDSGRIGQMVSNLLANALTHGDTTMPISVGVRSAEDGFELWVSNGGTAIPPDLTGKLFQPFYRGQSPRTEGLGLGLFIASEIARAHGGKLSVKSDQTETRFTFTIPRTSAQ